MHLRSLIVGLGLAVLPLSARAANGLRPRTPAVFEGVPCVMRVDKSVDPVLHIDYAVPFDDTALTPDELSDSRAHQFFAFSRQSFDFGLPVWINQADYDRAEANGDITKTFTDEDILELSSQWPAGSWVRITPDEPRLPITHEQAAMGVDWDTTDVPVGTWLVATYTWEPENNLWSFRLGAVKLVDPDDPDTGAPAAFIQLDGANATVGQPFTIPSCVDADEGSTLTASYGILEGNDEPTWIPFLEDEPAPTGDQPLELTPPPEASNGTLKIRLEVTDPTGRTYVAFSPAVAVLADPNAGSGDDGSGGGCHIRSDNEDTAPLALALLVLAASFRRRS